MFTLKKEFHFQKYKNILHSRHFRSSFLLLNGLLFCIFLLGSIFTVTRAQKQLRSQLEQTADQTAAGIQDFLSGMEESAVFIGNLPSVNTLLGLPHPSIDHLSQMINDITSYSSVYSYESICLYMNRSQRIFDSSGGMYFFYDFYNKELLQTLLDGTDKELWLFNIPYQRYYGPAPAVSVIMYLRRLPLYETNCKGYISVAYPLDQLHKITEKRMSSVSYTACVTFRNQLLWSNYSSAHEQWNPKCTPEENESALFSSRLSFSSSPAISTRCTFYLTKTEYIKALLPPLFHWTLGCFTAAICIFIVSLLYSALMLQHLDAMMRKIGIIPYMDDPSNDMDEFMRMNAALDRMNSKMSDIDKLMQQNSQLIRERLLTGILYNYVDWKNLPSEYEEHGIIFPNEILAVILIFMPSLKKESDYTRREQLQLLVRTNATNAMSALGTAYSLYTEHDSICILLNTRLRDSLQEELSGVCVLLKENMKKNLSLYPLFSIGICSETDPRPWKAYQLARRNSIFTATDADDFILFGCQNEYIPAVDPDLLSLMSQAIIDKDALRLDELIHIFHDRYLVKTELSDSRRLCVIALSNIYATLLDISGDMPDSPLHHFLWKLENSNTQEECEKNLHAGLFGILSAGSRLSAESHTYIHKAIQYLEQHYQEPITIPQIADSVGLSSVYLTKLFKLATGKTLSEYLNYYRTQCSLQLLTNSDDTINEISSKVGYSDVRSYIRFFKKFYEITPGEYRREHSQKA